MYGFKFFDYDIYKRARSFKILLINVIAIINSKRHFNLVNQLERASNSILLNIAEGSLRKSDKEFYRYLEISLGSLNETLACLDIARELKLINNIIFENIALEASILARQMMALMKKLR